MAGAIAEEGQAEEPAADELEPVAGGRRRARGARGADGRGPPALHRRDGARLDDQGTLLRKDPTFSEAEYGFRAFGALLRHLADRNVIELSEGSAKDASVSPPCSGRETSGSFRLLRGVVADLQSTGRSCTCRD
ncbi:MAG: hypothetical protein ACXWX0_07455 [Actinomycetota bacterium]